MYRKTFLICFLFISITLAAQKELFNDQAIFFVVNDYDHQDLKSLKKPINNAKKIAAQLNLNYRFRTKVIENPSLEKIASTINHIKKVYSEGGYGFGAERLLLFFSGHGMTENQTGYFLSKDSNPKKLAQSAFSYETWRPVIDSIKCQHIMVAIDASYGNTFAPDLGAPAQSESLQKDEILQDDGLLVFNHEEYTSRTLFTTSVGTGAPNESHFSKLFLKALSSNEGKNGILNSTELFSFLEESPSKPHRGIFGKHHTETEFLFFSSVLSEYKYEIFEASADQEESTQWYKAIQRNSESGYEAYLNAYPKGKFVKKAKSLKEKIQLSKNANTDHPTWVDGDGFVYTILEMKDGKQWITPNLSYTIDGSKCYDNLFLNCDNYGRLYTIEAAKKGCNSLGEGWRLPTKQEWQLLAYKYGGLRSNVTSKMIDIGNPIEAFLALTEDGTSGFAGQLGGAGIFGAKEEYFNQGIAGEYWSDTKYDSLNYWSIFFFGTGIHSSISSKEGLAYVRCIKD